MTITRACFILNILDSREDIADVLRIAEVSGALIALGTSGVKVSI